MDKNKIKEFFLSSWSIDNKIIIYLFTVFLIYAGIRTYQDLPKESFPDIVAPKFYITTVYAGNSPSNIENTVTKPLEKKLKSIPGIKKLSSNSLQDVSVIVAEFNTNVSIDKARQQIKDKIDEARTDLPASLTRAPNVKELSFSDIPIMYVNIAGSMPLIELKKYAEEIKDKIEGLPEITEVRMVGAPEREIQINLDMFKMQSMNLSLGDVERALSSENLNITGGQIPMGKLKRTLSIKAEFKSVDEIKNLLVQSQSGAKAFLKDIAYVADTVKEAESFARLNNKNVITLQVIKRPGENLIAACDKIYEIIREAKKEFPASIEYKTVGDQSEKTRVVLHDLINTIIIGFILVTLILMFFMGVTNALFVGMSVPLSMCIAFLMMPLMDFTMNMVVLFAFLLALGIVVDDAIVVIENTHRIFGNGRVPIIHAAKQATGEVFLPVLSGTITTLAPFIPLMFWPGIIGKFMFYLPVTMIVSLLASLLVAYTINPVFAVDFMKTHNEEEETYSGLNKNAYVRLGLYVLMSVLFHFSGAHAMGNLILFFGLFLIIHRLFLFRFILQFQNKWWPRFQNAYAAFLSRALQRPGKMIVYTLLLLLVSVLIFMIRKPPVIFFPQGDPNNIYVYVKLPEGTNPAYTNEVMKQAEKKVTEVLGENNPDVSSMITNVTIGVTDPADEDQNSYPNRGKIAINFVNFSERKGPPTSEYLIKLQNLNWNIPGAEITVNKEQAGPPVSKPIVIEVSGNKFERIIEESKRIKKFIEGSGIEGIVELKSDFTDNKPEIVIDINREQANREGIYTGQLAMEVRKAVFGLDNPTKFRDDNDEYPIQIRYAYDQRINLEAIKNTKITFRDMNMGGILRSVPLSAFCDIRYENTYGGIKRKQNKRVITLSSDVKEGFNPNAVADKVKEKLNQYRTLKDDVAVKFGGQQEEQKETAGFLGTSLNISIAIILIILMLQFNSFGKTVIILSEVLLSIIGVILGVAIFKMEMSIVMTGVGIVALAGIVVRNGILLIEFAEMQRKEGKTVSEAILEAGRIRMTPVMLTAISTILGLIPLAVGLNIDFESLLTHGDPKLYFGGDNVVFWGPLSWTMIFGLSFATFLTLILIPCMYLLAEKKKEEAMKLFSALNLPHGLRYVPFAVAVTKILFKNKIKQAGLF
ncbi:MAG: efflux RND transporter permease subunit [Bacteroidia bacterium]|nr:efflux RND transporter permease subunit [Bacteroidia bacterium]